MMKKERHDTPMIMGKNCLEELLHHEPERILTVYTSKSRQDPLFDRVQTQGIPIQFRSNQELTRLVQSDSHQSFVASVKPRRARALKEFLERVKDQDRSLVLLLDSIYDPQNLGTLLRAAECFGTDAVIWSKNRGADVTPVVTKTSVGATEIVNMIKVSNLVETVKKMQEEGYWAVAADVNEQAFSLYSYQFPSKTILVMGSEGKGIQMLLSKQVDDHVYIPMMGKIDSLNVSQATAVFLSHWAKQRNTHQLL